MNFKKYYNNIDTPFAVFVLAPTKNGKWAATTRAADRGEGGKIGLPGGKVDHDETPVSAAIREAEEEGWRVVNIENEPSHKAIIDGNPVWWFKAEAAEMLDSYKEKGRITPIEVELRDIANSGYGNEWVLKKLEEKYQFNIVDDSSGNFYNYTFRSKYFDYDVGFELSEPYGWEMSFGIIKDGDIDTRVITNQPDDVMEVLDTIFDDILKDFIRKELDNDDELNIILAPQRVEGESHDSDPFQSKRGKLYIRIIQRIIKKDPFYNDKSVSFELSKFSPKSIIMKIMKK